MMFLQYASLGLWNVTFGTYIASNTGQSGRAIFDSDFIGNVLTTQGLGAIFAPVLLGVIADRHCATEKLLTLLHLASAACLVAMANCNTQGVFYLATFAYFQCYSPTSALTSSLALRHLPNAQNDFPFVRAMGTVGWIGAGLVVGLIWRRITGDNIEATATPMALAIGCHLLMAAYSMTLPATPPLGAPSRGWKSLAGGGDLWSNRSFVVLITLSALVLAPAQFYNGFVNPFLNFTGFADAAAKLSLGQATEVGLMICLPWFLVRFRLKTLFLCGASAWAARFGMFAACGNGEQQWLAYPAIIVHGICFTFVYITGQLYVDRLASRHARAAAQGVHAVAVFGVGNLIGAFAAGVAQARYLTPEGVEPPPYDWASFWSVACVISTLGAVAFALLFRESKRRD